MIEELDCTLLTGLVTEPFCKMVGFTTGGPLFSSVESALLSLAAELAEAADKLLEGLGLCIGALAGVGTLGVDAAVDVEGAEVGGLEPAPLLPIALNAIGSGTC